MRSLSPSAAAPGGCSSPWTPSRPGGGQTVEVHAGRLVGAGNALADGLKVPGPDGRAGPLLAGGQDVGHDAGGDVRHVMGEAMPAGDLKRDGHHLQEVARWLQRPLDPADVEDVQLRGAKGDGPLDRDAVDDPAVHEMLTADLDHREQAGYSRGGDDGVDEATLGEPVLRGPLDARRDALERDGKLLERPHGQEAVKKAAQRQASVEVRTLPDEGAGDAEGGVEDALLAKAAPDGLEAVEHLQARLGGDGGTIDGPDRGPDDEIRQDAS